MGPLGLRSLSLRPLGLRLSGVGRLHLGLLGLGPLGLRLLSLRSLRLRLSGVSRLHLGLLGLGPLGLRSLSLGPLGLGLLLSLRLPRLRRPGLKPCGLGRPIASAPRLPLRALAWRSATPGAHFRIEVRLPRPDCGPVRRPRTGDPSSRRMRPDRIAIRLLPLLVPCLYGRRSGLVGPRARTRPADLCAARGLGEQIALALCWMLDRSGPARA